jgi:succinate dehydrogenase flavin-adding protein (antitoxin of CptAB toxin-antitoxin module)
MIKPNRENAIWMAAGALILILLFLFVFHFYQKQNPVKQLAFKASRVDLVSRMRLVLASASEAEKSAVLAITDQDSQTFAGHARTSAAEAEQARLELGELLKTGSTKVEKDLFNQFSELFAEFQRIDNDLLALAVKNTNIKAYSLAFGPATAALNEMNAALSRLIALNAGSKKEKQLMFLAYGTEISGLKLQTLIPPHIAEESEQKMDELEALMAKEDKQIRRNLNELTALWNLNKKANLATAVSSYDRFNKIITQILALSRENTNIKSLAISLNQKRKVMLLCQDVLNKLQKAILEEPIAGVTYGSPARPR